MTKIEKLLSDLNQMKTFYNSIQSIPLHTTNTSTTVNKKPSNKTSEQTRKRRYHQ